MITLTSPILGSVHFLIDRVVLYEFFVRADPVDLSALQNENAIGVLYRRSTLGDDDLRRLGNKFLKRLPDERVRLGIDRGGRIVQNEYFGFFQKSARNTQTLFLTARNITSTLFDIGIVSVGGTLRRVRRPSRPDCPSADFL